MELDTGQGAVAQAEALERGFFFGGAVCVVGAGLFIFGGGSLYGRGEGRSRGNT